MANTCCKLVGNFEINVDGIISISTRTQTEVSKTGNSVIIGATTGVVSISAYADNEVHTGCNGRAAVSIPWIRKYDCDTDEVIYLFSGEGESNYAGASDNLFSLIELRNEIVSHRAINASASSGPATIYEDELQHDGYGLIYYGNPWTFNTSTEEGVMIDTGIGDFGSMYLQSFSLQLTANQLPIANYEFVYQVTDREIQLTGGGCNAIQ